jgi:dTDP-4-dehydrorhamnose 3,5-epimerase
MKEKNISIEDIGSEFRDSISTQDYSKKPLIDGVKIVELKQFIDDGGSFNEVVRVEKGLLKDFPEFELKQVSYSLMEAGAIKAFHLHLKQEDIWFVPASDKMVVGLVDLRESSSTYKVEQRLVLGSGRALLVYIPRGVAHGAANLSKKSAQIFYFVSEEFDLENPDEKRLPWDLLGKDFWEREKG